MTHTLEWEGPYSFCELALQAETRSRFGEPGVYLWTEPSPSGRIVSYVGKATGRPPLAERQLQHYLGFIACAYQIPAWARACQSPWELDSSKPEVVQVLFDEAVVTALAGEAFRFANQMQVFLCRRPKEEVDRLESQLIFDIQPTGNKRGRARCPQPALDIQHKNARWATAEVLRQCRPGLCVA